MSVGYREAGYFPEAVVNFLALLGWNDGTEQELFSLDELIEKFDLTRVHKAGAKFDYKKNTWFNHQYLQKQSDKNLALSLNKILIEKGVNTDLDLEKMISMTKERANFVADLWDLNHYFFEAPQIFDENVTKKFDENTVNLLSQTKEVIQKITNFDSLNVESVLKNWLAEQNIGVGKLMQPLRIAMVGELKGPHLFDIMSLIGQTETLKRLDFFIKTFKNA